MDMDIKGGQIGPETKFDLAIKDGSLVFKVDYSGKQAVGGMYAGFPIKAVLELVKTAIPGSLDDYLINAGEAALGL